MKLNLTVLTPGKMLGKVIPITRAQFFIGRDPGCHLRPSSTIVSNLHCALVAHDGEVFVLDFNSMNGTFINEAPVHCAGVLRNEDQLRVGPMVFGIQIEVGSESRTPSEAESASSQTSEEEAAAALLEPSQEDAPTEDPDEEGTPMVRKETEMDILPLSSIRKSSTLVAERPSSSLVSAVGGSSGDGASAAEDILQKYFGHKSLRKRPACKMA